MQRLHENVYKVDFGNYVDEEDEGTMAAGDEMYNAICVPRMDYWGDENPSDEKSLVDILEKRVVDRCVIQLYGIYDLSAKRAKEASDIVKIFRAFADQKDHIRIEIMEPGVESDGRNEYHIDFHGCKRFYDWHDAILQQLPYVPDFYGKNTDALRDLFVGFIDDDSVMVLHGTQSFDDDFAVKEMAGIVKVFREEEERYGQPRVVIAD